MFTQIFYNILISASVYIVISFSFTLIYYSAKFFHMGHAAVITSGAYLTLLFYKQYELPFFVSIVLAVLFSIITGVFCEMIVYKPLRKKNATPMFLLIASLGLYVILQNCISMCWGDETKTLRSGEVKIGHQILNAYITETQILIVLACTIILICGLIFMKYTKTGRNIRAVSSNAEMANIVGINSNKVILWAFVVGSAIGSVAGILTALDTDMTPTMGFNLLLYGIVAMIIGGVGSISGLIGGAFLLSAAQHLSAYYIDSKWTNAVAYIILILFLIWKPLGFSGKKLKKTEI
jgi:branched-chain amino acid transport system permease protein